MLADAHVRKSLPRLLAGFDILDVPEVTIADAVLDSRQAAPGALFMACAGSQAHGLAHAPQAIAAGAAAVAWEPADIDAPALEAPEVAVPGLSMRAGEIAARLYDRPAEQIFVAGVTGTDGKTSCAWLMARAMAALGSPCGYLGTLGFGAPDDLAQASHTTPDAARLQYWLARMVASDYEAAALEVSSHALAQHRTDAVAFDVAVLTQVGRDHLDYHGDAAAYVAAKRRLFDSPGLRFAVLNADDSAGREWLAAPADGAARIAYGRAEAVSGYPRFVHIVDVTAVDDGLVLELDTHAGRDRLKSGLVGAFNASNLAATLGVLLARDVPLAAAVEALSKVPAVPGRMQRVAGRADQPLVIVDYAHTPGALEAALGAAGAHAAGRLFCVFGCGGDRDPGKRALMGAAVAARAHRFWITDDNPRGEDPAAIVAHVIEGISETVTAASRYEIVHARAAAIERAIGHAGPGDVVLIAGKGHETSQQYSDTVYAFDDRTAAARALEAL